MEIENSSLMREVDKIIKGDTTPVHYEWKAIIKADGASYEPLKVLTIDTLANYEGNYADEILIVLAMPAGTFFKRIYPYQGAIDITLIRKPKYESGIGGVVQEKISTEVYTATLIDTGSPIIDGNTRNTPTEENLNLTSITDVTFQLINKSLEQLRLISVGGIYRGGTVEDVVKNILTSSSKIKYIDNTRSFKGVQMVPPSNKKARDHVVIPQGTMLMDVPDHINKHCGGFYSTGLGYYFQNDFWYLYPTFDTTRFNTADETLTIINVPPRKFPGVERTYRKNGRNLTILGTGSVKYSDSSDVDQLNDGNGVRFASADKFMNGFTKTENNKTVASRGKNNSEFVTQERDNKNNNVRLSGNAITANPMMEYARLARRQGGLLTMVWEHSNPTLITPGMVGKIMYLDGEDIKTLYGVVLQAHTFVGMSGQGMFGDKHMSTTSIAMFVSKPKP